MLSNTRFSLSHSQMLGLHSKNLSLQTASSQHKCKHFLLFQRLPSTPVSSNTLLTFMSLITMSNQELKLLTSVGSPYGLRAVLALQIKGLKYERVDVDLKNKGELLLRSNPIHKRVPVLIHNGKPVCESAIVVQYIDEVWPSAEGKEFLPKDPYDRALTRFWADFVDKKMIDQAFTILKAGGEALEKAKQELVDDIAVLENAFASIAKANPYFGGESPGYVDIMLAPIAVWYSALEAVTDFSLFTTEKSPTLCNWIKAFEEEPSLKECLGDPEKIKQFALSRRKTQGLAD